MYILFPGSIPFFTSSKIPDVSNDWRSRRSWPELEVGRAGRRRREYRYRHQHSGSRSKAVWFPYGHRRLGLGNQGTIQSRPNWIFRPKSELLRAVVMLVKMINNDFFVDRLWTMRWREWSTRTCLVEAPIAPALKSAGSAGSASNARWISAPAVSLQKSRTMPIIVSLNAMTITGLPNRNYKLIISYYKLSLI